MERMAKNYLGRLFLMLLLLLPLFYTGKAVQNSRKSLGGDIPKHADRGQKYCPLKRTAGGTSEALGHEA